MVLEQSEMKENAGKAAVDALIRDGVKVGLGTGSTAITVVQYIGLLLAQGKLKNISAVTTSLQTEMECEKWNIPTYSLNSRHIGGSLDVAIDGADQIDSHHFCVKGGGGALLMEKIVAYSSTIFALVVDETKLVEHLGLTFPVAVEVIPSARVSVCKALDRLQGKGVVRLAVRKAGPVITDHGNIILDTLFQQPIYPAVMEEEINCIPGVMENGLFAKKGPHVFVARADGTVEARDYPPQQS
ncbi:MAG: ribose-5-phosphate isomerase RpiA [Treponema sp.]|jgi:ribose 5-phosphate isomerase A|nr:ribose-5-phosphate isomerase RpiA [Treponema sp.]